MTGFLEGMSYPARLASRLMPNGRPVVRVKAWRSPNEDRPAADIVFRRVEAAYLAPLLRTTLALAQRNSPLATFAGPWPDWVEE